MKPFLISLLIFSLSLISCKTTSPSDIQSTEQKSKYTTWNENRNFNQDYSAWQGLIQPVVGLPSADVNVPSWVWNNVPNSGVPLFLGVAYPHANVEKEKQVALEYAAMQAVRYMKIIGLAHSISVYTSLGHYYGQEIIAHYNESEIADVSSQLQVYSEYRDDTGTYLLAALPSLGNGMAFPKIPDGYKVDVTASLPKIPGYILSVGGARKYIRMSDSLIAADENALAELLRQKEVHIVTQQELDVIEGSGDAYRGDTYEYSTGVINGFYIIARWTDGEYFYSLAIAPQ